MIISHTHQYLFVELPRTGSTAISAELCELYDGQSILHKHATYYDFLKMASPHERTYFVFSGIRSPLDDAVSLYFKYKTDHRRRYTNPKKIAKRNWLLRFFFDARYRFIKDAEADFPTYFRRYYRVPFNNWSGLSHKQFNFVIRFENLSADFEKALRMIGIEPKRPLPAANPTAGRKKDYLAYYTPEAARHARRIFGPFMKEWSYEFPAEWGDAAIPWWSEVEYRFLNVFRNAYWRFFRPYLHLGESRGE